MNSDRMMLRRFAKLFVIIAVSFAALFFVVTFVVDYLSCREVRFVLSSETKSITIYSEDEYNQLKESNADKLQSNSGELSGTGSIRIKAGYYYVIPSGDNLDDSAIPIEIKNDTKEIPVEPYFSSEYLSKNFTNQMADINQIITDKYKKIISNYSIDNGTFYHYGDWYVTSLYSNPTIDSGSDSYGIILHKVDGKWQIAAAPELVFRYDDHKDIPKDIINSVNRLVNQ